MCVYREPYDVSSYCRLTSGAPPCNDIAITSQSISGGGRYIVPSLFLLSLSLYIALRVAHNYMRAAEVVLREDEVFRARAADN